MSKASLRLLILIECFLKEEGLEVVEEYVQDDGAVYKGQLRSATGERHGYGI
jgi:hypothetical protein